jgi:hypothetical protein
MFNILSQKRNANQNYIDSISSKLKGNHQGNKQQQMLMWTWGKASPYIQLVGI